MTFDVSQLLDSQTDQAATRRPPLNPSKEYIGILGEAVGRNTQGKKDPSKSYTFIDWDVTVDLTADPEERARIGQDSVKLRHSVSVDTNETGIDWSAGKNTGLRLMREALGMNTPGQSFSIRSMSGRPIRIKIKHEEYPEGSGEMQDRISAVGKV